MRKVLLVCGTALAMSLPLAVSPNAAEYFVPQGYTYSPNNEKLPRLNSRRDQIQARTDEIEAQINERNQIPIERPITAIHSRYDAAVDWRACIDDHSPNVENIEVQSCHTGHIIDPDIWRIIGERLADGSAQ